MRFLFIGLLMLCHFPLSLSVAAVEEAGALVDANDTSWLDTAKAVDNVGVAIGVFRVSQVQKAVYAKDLTAADKAVDIEAMASLTVPSHHLTTMGEDYVSLLNPANDNDKLAQYFRDLIRLNTEVGNETRADIEHALSPTIYLTSEQGLLMGPLYARDWSDALRILDMLVRGQDGLVYEFIDQGIHQLIRRRGAETFALAYDWETAGAEWHAIRFDSATLQQAAKAAEERTKTFVAYMEGHDLGIVTEDWSYTGP